MIVMGKKIPSYLVGLFIILLALALFVPLVLMPYLSNKPIMEQQHAQAQATLRLYEARRNSIEEYKKHVNNLQSRWDELEAEMFVTAGSTTNDLNQMFSNLGITPLSINISDEQEVLPAETSSTGDPLCSIDIALNFTASPDKVLDVIDYFEQKSDGSYYIRTLNFSTVAQTDSQNGVTVARGDLNTSMNITLYYFQADAPSAQAQTPSSANTAA